MHFFAIYRSSSSVIFPSLLSCYIMSKVAYLIAISSASGENVSSFNSFMITPPIAFQRIVFHVGNQLTMNTACLSSDNGNRYTSFLCQCVVVLLLLKKRDDNLQLFYAKCMQVSSERSILISHHHNDILSSLEFLYQSRI